LRRGLFQLPRLRATTLFPLQLVRRRETRALPRQALILPFYHPLRSFTLTQTAPNTPRGSSLALQTIGLTGEYVGSREYQPGVPVRKWDYASWARLGQPVVREFSEPRHPSVAILVDTFFDPQQLDGSEVLPELEALLSLAASLTDAVLAEGNRIDLLAIGPELTPAGDRVYGEDQTRILQRLALANPQEEHRRDRLVHELEELTLTWDFAIVLSHRWDIKLDQLLDALTRHRVIGTRIVVRADRAADGVPPPHGLCHIAPAHVAAGTVDL